MLEVAEPRVLIVVDASEVGVEETAQWSTGEIVQLRRVSDHEDGIVGVCPLSNLPGDLSSNVRRVLDGSGLASEISIAGDRIGLDGRQVARRIFGAETPWSREAPRRSSRQPATACSSVAVGCRTGFVTTAIPD